MISPQVDLETHIADIMAVIEYEDLRDVILVGHSYGGMVATGVADRARDRVRHLAYLDAFVPADGQSLNDLRGPAPETALVDGWLVPPMPSAPDTAPEDLDWTRPRRRHQPAPSQHPVEPADPPLHRQCPEHQPRDQPARCCPRDHPSGRPPSTNRFAPLM